jgi:L-alanine-DL-glutamate epimerase-like enolase superfamily enzyme
MREKAPMKVKGLEVLRCDAGWRNYHFLKLTTDEGIVGWSEFDEGFCSPGVSAVIERLAGRVAGQPVFDRERIYTELYCFTRPAAGGVVAEGLGAIENALLDAKAKALGVPCHALLGGKLRDRIRVYWSHCATWRINHPTLYKPAITSLDGVKAIRAEVREKGFGELKTNIFILRWRSARLAPRIWGSVYARAQCRQASATSDGCRDRRCGVERGLAVDEDRGHRGRSMRSISLRTISTATWPR